MCDDIMEHVINMSKSELARHRDEIMKHSEVVHTEYADIILIKHDMCIKSECQNIEMEEKK